MVSLRDGARDPLLVAIVGPTGSGKTALSLALAERCGGEIVNCDSVALYRGLEIGAAKPSPAERARVLHHLLDVVDLSQTMTAGEYARRARAALEGIRPRGHLPIVVGGTGLYLRALLEGLFPGPQRSEQLRRRLRERQRSRGSPYLHRVLRRLDAAVAARIHPNDVPKLIRAIEVCLEARRPMSELWQRGRERLQGFRVLRIGLNPDREQLYARLNQRARRMFEEGLVEETARILEHCPHSWVLGATGYRQAAQLLRGELDREAAIAAAQQAHRNYAKRQMTWFRREPEMRWLAGFGDEASIQAEAVDLVKSEE